MTTNTVHEHGSAIIPLVRFLCALSKEEKLQPQCIHYSSGVHGCVHLGNWTEGLRMCNSTNAKDGYFNAIGVKKGD
jgi:hypothetical protein